MCAFYCAEDAERNICRNGIGSGDFMEILKRSKGQSGEGVSFLESENNVKEEAIRRGCKAGICNSEGGPVCSGKIISMPSNEQYRKNYRRIFGHD